MHRNAATILRADPHNQHGSIHQCLEQLYIIRAWSRTFAKATNRLPQRMMAAHRRSTPLCIDKEICLAFKVVSMTMA